MGLQTVEPSSGPYFPEELQAETDDDQKHTEPSHHMPYRLTLQPLLLNPVGYAETGPGLRVWILLRGKAEQKEYADDIAEQSDNR